MQIAPSRCLCVTLVHGTWGQNAAFFKAKSIFQLKLKRRFGDRIQFRTFSWSGKNSQLQRLQAAEDFATDLADIVNSRPDAVHFVVAHSHGGNVALWGLGRAQLRGRVSGVVCMGTPFIQSRLRRFWPVSACVGLLPVLGLLLCMSVAVRFAGEGAFAGPGLARLTDFIVGGLFVTAGNDSKPGMRRTLCWIVGVTFLILALMSSTLNAPVEGILGLVLLPLLTVVKVCVIGFIVLVIPWALAAEAVEACGQRLASEFAQEYPRMLLNGLRILSVPAQGDEALMILRASGWLAAVPRVVGHWSVVSGLLAIQVGLAVYGGFSVTAEPVRDLALSWAGTSLALKIAASAALTIVGLSVTSLMIVVLYVMGLTVSCLGRQHPLAFGMERPSLALIGAVSCRDVPLDKHEAAEFRDERFSLRAFFADRGLKGVLALRHSWMYTHPAAIKVIGNWLDEVAKDAAVGEIVPVPSEYRPMYATPPPSRLDHFMWMWMLLMLAIGAWLLIF